MKFSMLHCNDHGASLKGKQVSEISYCTKYAIHKTPKWVAGTMFNPELFSVDVVTGYIDGNAVDGHTWGFIKMWKKSCEDENVVEVCRYSIFVTNNILFVVLNHKNLVSI